ncbi:MAG TPA: hypothetical protein VEA60_06660 [Allosphingosinicella sp.]|nr:hypothetical protein [Allosphingosinicella sp.]
MNSLWRRRKWPACAAVAALSACTPPAETNTVAQANAAAEPDDAATGDEAAEPASPAANESAAPAPNAAAPAKEATAPAAAEESYAALGQEPGWALRIGGGRIDYSGNYGEKKINVARPEPRPSFNGRRYVTPRLIVDITYVRCNDAMSGFGFEHQVMVIADGETYQGCGGARKKERDM